MSFLRAASGHRPWIGLLLGVAIAFFVLAARFWWFQGLDRIEDLTYDLRFRLRSDISARPEVVVIGIEDRDLDRLGQWPWPRFVWSAVLKEMIELDIEPSVLVLDVLFLEPGGLAGYLDNQQVQDEQVPQTRDALLDLQWMARVGAGWDQDLASLFELFPGRIVLSYYFNMEGERRPHPKTLEEIRPGIEFILENESLAAPKDTADLKAPDLLRPPLHPFLEAAGNAGFTNIDKDVDSVTRKTWAAMRYQDRVLPSLFLVALCRHLGIDSRDVEIWPGEHIVIPSPEEPIFIPIDKEGRFKINFRGQEAFLKPPEVIPWSAFLEGMAGLRRSNPGGESGDPKFDPRSLNGKIVLVGMFAEGFPADKGAVPTNRHYPMVALHANVLDNILTGDYVRPGREAKAVLEVLLVVILSLAVGTSVRYLSPARGAISTTLLIAVYLAVCQTGFDRFCLDLPAVRPVLAVFLTYTANAVYYFVVERRGRRRAARFLMSYMPKNVAERLLDSGQDLRFGGDRVFSTILFSDIRGFTSWSEKRRPEAVVELLNEYFAEMTEVIFAHEGTLDKFMGDAIMVFFGSPILRHPDDPLRAVRAALAMQERMKAVQERWRALRRESFGMGIGICTGDVVIGNMGTENRAEYTAIGDAVNLAFRLQGLAEAGEIVVSESTYTLIADQVVAEARPPVSVKGKDRPVAVYSVRGLTSRPQGT